MSRSPVYLCAGMGSFVGGYVPVVLWHASSFSLSSIVFGLVGAVAGIWLGLRIIDL
jgi:hypothetical protein